ncbi:hypothetical protein BCF44_122115 [Kutzneria buriramensis]|uniref:Uncharacterized protein n=2 Tax=Kutzneria buriramensis TaxID=1045776 RepID=A0A3E0GYG2_9PSEU|nr:hypothetical protein BCF44_122115 [Kutzneria buriramensis]
MASSKGTLARRLAARVEKKTGVRTEAGYDSKGRSTEWYLEWRNGPTREAMRAVAEPLARKVPGLDFTIGYKRTSDDRHLVAAWIHQATHDDDAGPWSIDTAFTKTGFPDDIAHDDPVWALVDYVFASCGGPNASGYNVVKHIAKIGVRGLRMEYVLDQHERVDAPVAASVVEPLLEVSSALSEDTQGRVRGLVDTLMSELAGRSPRSSDPRAQVLIAEAVHHVLAEAVNERQRRQALMSVAEGTPLYRLSMMLGKSASTLSKRWPAAEFNADLAPLVWFHAHRQAWTRACAQVVTEVRALGNDVAQHREVFPHLHWLELDERDSDSLPRLLTTTEVARTLVAAVPEVAERTWRERRLRRQLHGAARDDDVRPEVPGPALRELADLLAQFDAPPVPRRRGGARTPRSRTP